LAETINMRRRGNRLEACALVDEEALADIPEGKDLSVTIHRTRSTKQHRFFWALLQLVCENHETYRNANQLLLWLKIRLGYVEEVKFHSDEVWWVAKSISFNAMGQDEFRNFFDAALDVIVDEVIPGILQEDLLREIEHMVGFKLTDLWKVVGDQS